MWGFHLFKSTVYIILHFDFKTDSVFFFRRHRYTTYRQFVRWCWQYLGKEVRIIIPSCAVNAIRTAYPDHNQNYTGFHQVDSDSDWIYSTCFEWQHLNQDDHIDCTKVEESQQVAEHYPHSCVKQHKDQKQSSSMFLHNLKMEMYLLLYIVFLIIRKHSLIS